MKRILILLLLVCLLLTGCTQIASNTYLSVTPHVEQAPSAQDLPENTAPTVTNRTELRGAVLSFIRSWTEEGVLLVQDYQGDIDTDLNETMRYALQEEPIGAYAVDYADAELNGTAKQGSIRIRIVFRRSAAEIASIVTVSDTAAAAAMILEALENYDSALTLRIRNYVQTDYLTMIQNYCLEHPETMVAIPTVTGEVYPKEGDTRILELRFDYPESRDDLRQRQASLATILTSAASYVRNGEDDLERLTLLHRFLTGRFSYTFATETPQMPAYNLLCLREAHSFSFALVVRAQCQAADIDCMLVSGTRGGLPHYWNIITLDGVYYHLDLMRAVELGETELNLFEQTELLKEEGYVWDRSVYPVNPDPEPTQPPAVIEPTEPTEPTDPTAPTENTGETAPTQDPTESTEEPTEEPTESTPPSP